MPVTVCALGAPWLLVVLAVLAPCAATRGDAR
jgi:hypothetical protein